RAEIDTAYEKLKADGVKVGKIHDHRDGTASFYGRDPFGNWFEYLYEPDDLFEGKEIATSAAQA
ncbi:MAG: VOC family protein, partial [Cyanobacteria bacterium J06555_13]